MRPTPSNRALWIAILFGSILGLAVLLIWRPAQLPHFLRSDSRPGQSSAVGGAESAPSGRSVRPELSLSRTEEYDYDPPEPGSYSLPVIKAAADGQVLNSAGQLRSLRTMLEGRVTILSFIYLRCASPKACPYATGVLNQIHEITRTDSSLAKNLQLITMSFDPEHDTPERMAQFGKWFQEQGGADWHFLTSGDQAELQPILEAYDQTVDRKANMNDPLGPFFHPVRVFLTDPEGRIRNIYSFGMLDPRMILTDVRTLLLETATPPRGQGANTS